MNINTLLSKGSGNNYLENVADFIHAPARALWLNHKVVLANNSIQIERVHSCWDHFRRTAKTGSLFIGHGLLLTSIASLMAALTFPVGLTLKAIALHGKKGRAYAALVDQAIKTLPLKKKYEEKQKNLRYHQVMVEGIKIEKKYAAQEALEHQNTWYQKWQGKEMFPLLDDKGAFIPFQDPLEFWRKMRASPIPIPEGYQSIRTRLEPRIDTIERVEKVTKELSGKVSKLKEELDPLLAKFVELEKSYFSHPSQGVPTKEI